MGTSKRKPDPHSSNMSKHNGKKPKHFNDSDYMLRYNNLTPFNQSLSNILIQVEPRGILTAPPKIKGLLNRRDMSKYCRYHCENRHGIDDC